MTPFSLYTLGTMSLGRNPADITQDLTVARRAMEAGYDTVEIHAATVEEAIRIFGE